MKTECAWCLKEQGKESEPGNHGICEKHEAQVDKETDEYIRAKKAMCGKVVL